MISSHQQKCWNILQFKTQQIFASNILQIVLHFSVLYVGSIWELSITTASSFSLYPSPVSFSECFIKFHYAFTNTKNIDIHTHMCIFINTYTFISKSDYTNYKKIQVYINTYKSKTSRDCLAFLFSKILNLFPLSLMYLFVCSVPPTLWSSWPPSLTFPLLDPWPHCHFLILQAHFCLPDPSSFLALSNAFTFNGKK